MGIVVLISDKTDFKIKQVTRHKYGHFIMIKGKIYQDDITIINIYAPNLRTPKYIKQLLTELKRENTYIYQGCQKTYTHFKRCYLCSSTSFL